MRAMMVSQTNIHDDDNVTLTADKKIYRLNNSHQPHLPKQKGAKKKSIRWRYSKQLLFSLSRKPNEILCVASLFSTQTILWGIANFVDEILTIVSIDFYSEKKDFPWVSRFWPNFNAHIEWNGMWIRNDRMLKTQTHAINSFWICTQYGSQ